MLYGVLLLQKRIRCNFEPIILINVNNMKKIFFLAVAVTFLASCTTTIKTATSYDVNDNISSFNDATLEISNRRASLNDWKPEGRIKRGGKANIMKAAVSELLRQSNDADVLVAPQFDLKIRHGLFSHGVKRVSVTGYPARYTKFQQVPQK